MNTKRLRRRGLTLIEVLAVAALLSLVAAALLGTFTGVTDRARVDTLLHDLAQVDARARLHAREGTSVAIAVDPVGRTLLAAARSSGERFSEAFWPDGWDVKLIPMTRDSTRRARAIIVEAGGTSPDYAFEVKTPLGARRLDVSGLTGWTSVGEVTR